MKCMYERNRKKHRNPTKTDYLIFNTAVSAMTETADLIQRASSFPEKHIKPTIKEIEEMRMK